MALALQFMNRGKEVQRLEKVGKEFNEFVEDAGRKRWAEPVLNLSRVLTLPLTSPPQGGVEGLDAGPEGYQSGAGPAVGIH